MKKNTCYITILVPFVTIFIIIKNRTALYVPKKIHLIFLSLVHDKYNYANLNDLQNIRNIVQYLQTLNLKRK
jgi:hypothetical protein